MVTARDASMADPRSVWVGFERGKVQKVQVHPRCTVDLPRVGVVQVDYECDRYLQSVWHADEPRGEAFSDWRLIIRKVDPSHGVGDWGSATRKAIEAACEPIILAWLASPLYAAAYRVGAADAMRREITRDGHLSEHGISRLRSDLATLRPEMTAADARRFARVIDTLEKASTLLG